MITKSLIFCFLTILLSSIAIAIDPIVLVHGGAGDIADDRHDGKNRGTILAVRMGMKKLNETGSVLDAVEAAVRSMELDDYFNAGYGSVLTWDGDVEMDAAIMDGSNLDAGCVSIVEDILHPISLARSVMENTVHTFLAGEGVMTFAREQGFDVLYPPGQLVTDYAREALEQFKENQNNLDNRLVRGQMKRDYGEVGTVGAVAIDENGNIAVATSTGGITGKLPGRIGDSPILGAGSYADNNIGGISATGHGETIMRFNLATEILKRMQYLNQDAQTATKEALVDMTDKFDQTGGAITIGKDGDIGIYFSSNKMAWAYQKGEDCIHYGVARDEDLKYECDD